ncbi:glutathione S-transferase C-terminal-like protein [Favolaschia claudopus]|uniref:Glutathione S-transferase C-terminal-like protein n=1 Tax=Favolaschia claudopus TaxID=2862362 RepID=A0AAW0DAG4_9AGAR
MASVLRATRRFGAIPNSLQSSSSLRPRYATMASKPIILYAVGTPNGKKASIFLEELKAAYGLEYEYKKIDFSKTEQKEPWFLELNPNGRIPAIVDRSKDNFAVFETGAILLYLQQHYDKENRFGFDAATKEGSEVQQWMFWANAGLGPMMGQAGHFKNLKEPIPYALNRYVDESKRLFGVMEIRLKDHEYLVANKYSIADVNAYTWVAAHTFIGLSLDEWPGVKRWFDKIGEREAVKAGNAVP